METTETGKAGPPASTKRVQSSSSLEVLRLYVFSLCVSFLPSSEPALVLAVGLLAALNSAIFATVISKSSMAVLEGLNLVFCWALLWLALRSQQPSFAAFAMVDVLLCFGLLIGGIAQLPKGLMRRCLAAQQAALASTLICWALVQQLRTHFELGPCRAAA